MKKTLIPVVCFAIACCIAATRHSTVPAEKAIVPAKPGNIIHPDVFRKKFLTNSALEVTNSCSSGYSILAIAAGYLYHTVSVDDGGSFPFYSCSEEFCETDVSGSQTIWLYLGNPPSTGTHSITVTDANGNVQTQTVTSNYIYQFDNVFLSSSTFTTITTQ